MRGSTEVLNMDSKKLSKVCSLLMLHVGLSACFAPKGEESTSSAEDDEGSDGEVDEGGEDDEDGSADDSGSSDSNDESDSSTTSSTTDDPSTTAGDEDEDEGDACEHECLEECTAWGGEVMDGTCSGGATCCAGATVPSETSDSDESGNDADSDTSSDTNVSGGGDIDWIHGDGNFTSPREDMAAECELSGELPSNYDNDKLPDPFLKLDGTRISAKSEFLCLRKELETAVGMTAHSMKPAPPESVSGSVSGGMIQVSVTDNGQTVSFSASYSLPGNAQRPAPAVIAIGGGGFGGGALLGGILNEEGVGTITFNEQSICAEGSGGGTFSTLYGNSHSCQVAWSWAVSRIIDVIEQNPGELDPFGIGMTGCSRLGKVAWSMGAWDQRVALTIPHDPGTGGIASWRIANNPGNCCNGDNNNEAPQSLGSCCSEARGWFGPEMCGGANYQNNPNSMPADSHFMGAMYAPRGMLILDNPFIGHLNPIGGHVAAQATLEVYKALGFEKNLYYFSAPGDGQHCLFNPEAAPMTRSAVRAFLTRTEEPNGGILIHEFEPDRAAKMYGELADWADWTAPTLE